MGRSEGYCEGCGDVTRLGAGPCLECGEPVRTQAEDDGGGRCRWCGLYVRIGALGVVRHDGGGAWCVDGRPLVDRARWDMAATALVPAMGGSW